jgi:hypothetical protein
MKRLFTFIFSLFASLAFAQQLNEVFFNPPGTDQGAEFVEIKGSPNASLSNVWLLVIEGDGSPAAGTLDLAVNLTGQSIGSNGLFLIRDASNVLSPAPSSGTNVWVNDFNPDIENGSNTFILVSNFSGLVGTDYDSNDDGTLDSQPWASVIDAIGYKESGTAAEINYGTSLGFSEFVKVSTGGPSGTGFTPTIVFRDPAGVWYMSATSGTAPGPFTCDPARITNLSGTYVTATIDASPGVSNTPIPVELMSFKGTSTANGNKLNWITASEQDNSHFEIERSMDNRNFKKIADVKGVGTTQTRQYYSFVDENAASNLSYYRLKQVDYSGDFKYSNIVAITKSGKAAAFKAYPSVTHSNLTLEYKNIGNDAQVSVINILGRAIMTQKLTDTEGVQTMDVSRLPNGFYFVRLTAGSTQLVQRIQKQ